MFDTEVLKSTIDCSTLGWRNKFRFLKKLSATYIYMLMYDVDCLVIS